MPTRWTEIKRIYGFAKPYDFNVAIPALLNIPFLILMAVKFYGELARDSHVRFFGATGEVASGRIPEMYFFYAYVLMGFLLFNWQIRNPKIYWPLFIWFSIELCLGVWGAGLLPASARTQFAHRYDYQSLLQGTPAPDFNGENGDLRIIHNALGMRDTKYPPEDLKRGGLIFVYGGSTTYDVQVSQGSTWVEKLNDYLGPSYKTFNFGVPGYSTAEHVLQTAFYQDIDGVYPSCAIYYVGWNDLRNVHVTGLDRGYANFHLLTQPGNLATRRALNLETVSPLLKLVLKGASAFLDTIPYPDPKQDASVDRANDGALKAIFRRNVATIAAINTSRQIRTIVVGQILNRKELETGKYHAVVRSWLPFVKNEHMWTLQSEFNGLLKTDAAKDGYVYIDAGVDRFDKSDFADTGHFSARGAEKFALLISEEVRQACPAS
jgi:hypothetical protein